ncbi:hypothetical protein TNCV_4933761 [Trichonephila clavipes]|nr:hypothetical protein TNCV_4933761 [Trichonephila clavipes]
MRCQLNNRHNFFQSATAKYSPSKIQSHGDPPTTRFRKTFLEERENAITQKCYCSRSNAKYLHVIDSVRELLISGQGIGSEAYHEFETSTSKDPPCRAAMHVKSVGEL